MSRKDQAAPLRGQALVSDEAPAGLHPPGFDPSRDTYRGWEIRRGRWPEPDWMAAGPNYDAWTEGEGEWVDNGQKADAPTREALIEEIDIWFEENQ